MPAALNLETHSPNGIANFPSTVPTGSKSFLNYINARERAVAVAKDQIDKLNESAVKKLKNQHLATKAAKEERAIATHKQEKMKERTLNRKRYQDANNKQIL